MKRCGLILACLCAVVCAHAHAQIDPLLMDETLFFTSARGYFAADGTARLPSYEGYRIYHSHAGARYEVVATFYPPPADREVIIVRIWDKAQNGALGMTDICCSEQFSGQSDEQLTSVERQTDDILIVKTGVKDSVSYYREYRHSLADQRHLIQTHRLQPEGTNTALIASSFSLDEPTEKAALKSWICARRPANFTSPSLSTLDARQQGDPALIAWLAQCTHDHPQPR